METVHIIATCTNGKRLPIPDELRLRSVPGSTQSVRARNWWDRLESYKGPMIPALDMYRGHHWANVRLLPRTAAQGGFQADLWIASAGYGLMPSEAKIHPYSATFAPDNPDAVSPGIEEKSARLAANREWWLALAAFSGPAPHAPRSVADLARREPRSTFLVVASPKYVAAMESDLLEAAENLKEPRRLVVVSSGSSLISDSLTDHVVPSEAPLLEAGLGGTRLSLHARTAGKILSEASEWPIRCDVLRGRYQTLIQESPMPTQFDRQRMTDSEVEIFIRQALDMDPKAPCTRLLRQLRDGGKACEQARFRNLFQRVKGERNGS